VGDADKLQRFGSRALEGMGAGSLHNPLKSYASKREDSKCDLEAGG